MTSCFASPTSLFPPPPSPSPLPPSPFPLPVSLTYAEDRGSGMNIEYILLGVRTVVYREPG